MDTSLNFLLPGSLNADISGCLGFLQERSCQSQLLVLGQGQCFLSYLDKTAIHKLECTRDTNAVESVLTAKSEWPNLFSGAISVMVRK